jgi:hypothetical protein
LSQENTSAKFSEEGKAMKTMFAFLLLLAGPVAAQEMPCPMHKQHANTASHQADVERHGDEAMGFSHDKTTHHFLLYPDRGAIEVTANDRADSDSVQAVRTHLTYIATMFSDGNFATPMFIHSQVPPGVSIMQNEHANITYTFEELPAGGSVRIKSSNTEAVQAVHEFLRFQIEDHQTGDSTAITQPTH